MGTTLEFGTNLLAALALNTPVAPTAYAPVLDVDPRVESRSISALLSRYWGEPEGAYGAVTTSAPSVYADAIDVSRPTTEREELIGELRAWRLLAENWDGEGARVPNTTSIEEAVSFVNALRASQSLPEPLLHSSGRAGLYWNEGDLYADLEFTGDGRITYYVEHKGKGKHKGALAYDRREMPAVLATLLKA